MAEKQHIEWLLEGVEAWNKRREQEDFQPDFTGVDISSEFLEQGKFKYNEQFYSKFFNPDLRNINLSRAKLCGAKLYNANLANADLRNANLTKANLFDANLTGTNLTGANLSHAVLKDAILINANLTNAILLQAELFCTKLIGADLSYSQPWIAKLYGKEDRPRPNIKTVHLTTSDKEKIQSIICLLKECLSLEKKHCDDDVEFFFRGERCSSWELRPSLMRSENNKLRGFEGEMLFDLMSRQPEAFSGLTSAIGQWVLAQHHELRTRLLDITRNPLVALFNVCKKYDTQDGSDRKDGRLHVFAVPRDLIKPFNSDRISIIANFFKLRQNEQDLLLGKESDSQYDYAEVMDRLYHFIGHEKPYFMKKIDPRDLFRVFVVEPQRSFERIRAQSGAFLISAFHERFERDEILKWNDGIPVYDHYTLTVSGESKECIMDELRLLNITHESLFPGLDEAAKAVIQHYS